LQWTIRSERNEEEAMLRTGVLRWLKGGKRKRGDRRAAVRFAPPQEIICATRLEEDQGFSTARVCDISAGGACLLVKRSVDVGALIEVELINAAHTFLCTRSLRVLRTFPGNSGGCVVAGEFDRKLGYDELLPFIL
jgi:hypothetical protein